MGRFTDAILVCVVSAFTAGCISIGSEQVSAESYDKIVEGKTTTSQAFDLLGEPSSTTTSSGDVTVYGWSRTWAGPLSEKVETTIITLEYHCDTLARKSITTAAD